MSVANSCEQLGANVIYNPYNNSGWQSNPNAQNQQHQNVAHANVPETQEQDGNARYYYGYPGAQFQQPAPAPAPTQYVQQPYYQELETPSKAITHKKTTYVEATLEPKVQEELVYTQTAPLKSSVQQDYDLYLMEKEYYTNPHQPQKFGCEDMPLAQIYVRPQVYHGYSSPNDTMKQSTAFSELYRPYTPKKVTRGGDHHEQ